MSSNNDTASLLREGVQAARQGQRADARRLLRLVLEKDDANELAWMWLASVVETPQERRICLENVLEINPNNQRARQELDKMNGAGKPATGKTGPLAAALSSAAEQSTAKPAAPPAAKPTTNPAVPPAEPPNRPAAADLRADIPDVRVPPTPRRVTLPTPPPRTRRREFNVGYLVVGIGLVVLLGIGLSLATNGLQFLNLGPTVTPSETRVPTRTLSFAAVQQTFDAKTGTAVPQTPRGTIETLAVHFDILPSWTPLPTFTPPSSPTPTATSLPLAGLTILFAGEGRGRTNIGLYTIHGDGQSEQLIATGDARAFDAAWSPNGKQIAYITDVNGKEQLVVAAADGSNPQTLTQFGGKLTRTPSWSPDSKQIAVMSDDAGIADIYTLNADGSALKKLTDSSVATRDPAWSPNGMQIAYAADVTGQGVYQIYVRGTAPNTPTATATTAAAPATGLVATAAATVAFTPRSVPGGTLTALTQSGGSNYNPTWSPDGTQITFISTRDGRASVYVMAADGSGARSLTYQDGSGESRDPTWSPDSRWIIFSSNRDGGVFNLFALSPDSGDVTQITHLKSASVRPRVRMGT